MIQLIIDYVYNIGFLEFIGLISGLLCVLFLIKEHIATWLFGIVYVLISFFIFWEARLYGDFLLHIIFLILNIYGWYSWVQGDKGNDKLPVTFLTKTQSIYIAFLTIIGVIVFAQLLIYLPKFILGLEDSALPYWDSTTSIFSVTGMWLTTRKKIDNWYYWLIVDILASGIYYYKELYFYSLLYLIYIGLAIMGYLSWKRSFSNSHIAT